MENVKEIEKNEVKSVEELFRTERVITPATNIHEGENEFVLNAFMPGINKENVEVKFENRNLEIIGRAANKDENSGKYLLKEIPFGNYYRKFKLSEAIDESKIEASFDSGILEVKLHKHESQKPRTISIN